MLEQLSIFDLPPQKVTKQRFATRKRPKAKPPKQEPVTNDEQLRQWAFLYTISEHINGTNKNTIIRFMMSVEDAKKWCESDLSKGVMYGSRWMYCWTSVYNFTHCAWGSFEVTLDSNADNGSFDKKIESLGLKKYGIKEIPAVLEPLGVSVTIRGTKERLIDAGLTESDFSETEKMLELRKKRSA